MRESDDLALELRREIQDSLERFPRLKGDQLFIQWFIRAYFGEDEASATSALCGGPKDKGIDAIFVDDSSRTVFIIQGKYRLAANGKREGRSEVLEFSRLAGLVCEDPGAFQDFSRTLSPEVHERLQKARQSILKRDYALKLYFVTTAKCSSDLEEEARRIARADNAVLEVFDGAQLSILMADYLDGVAPPVPSLELDIESGGTIRGSSILQRHDGKTNIESWVFSMTAQTVAELFEKAGVRLFARNVRGFLGNTAINRGMEQTLLKEPEYFWYYNNGITIICDDAQQRSRGGKSVLWVKNPQVINGQQTTRTLARVHAGRATSAVLVKVIHVARVPGDKRSASGFEKLVSSIVAATNWQNAIRPSDLMANDRRQIEIEREFRKLGYWYMRKRQTKSEAKRAAGSQKYLMVKKDEIAQAVAACEMDPGVVREGKEGLFEEGLYPKVFPTAYAEFYLSRFLLMREVGRAARGKPEWAYAKWVVLNFVWSNLSRDLRKRTQLRDFRLACEQQTRSVGHLSHVIGSAYGAAHLFYRCRRERRGAGALDVSTFFKRKGLHREFGKFWKGPDNRYREQFRKRAVAFRRSIKEESEGGYLEGGSGKGRR
jgi:hypothetical protein